MATEQVDADASVETDPDGSGVNDHFRKVAVTSIAAFAGVAGAFVSDQLTAGLPATAAARDPSALMVVFALVALQPAALRAVGLLKEEFGAKDFLYIGFLTFSMWFIVWGVLLTSGG